MSDMGWKSGFEVLGWSGQLPSRCWLIGLFFDAWNQVCWYASGNTSVDGSFTHSEEPSVQSTEILWTFNNLAITEYFVPSNSQQRRPRRHLKRGEDFTTFNAYLGNTDRSSRTAAQPPASL